MLRWRVWVLWAAVCFLCCRLPLIAEDSLLKPLAVSSVPPCSRRPGVRSARSGLVELGDVMVSLTAQTTRDGANCSSSAVLWVTQSGVSQQTDLADSGGNGLALIDIASDGSGVLLSSLPDDPVEQMAIASFSDGSVKWIPLSEIAGLNHCHAHITAQAFEDSAHVIFAITPSPVKAEEPSCPANLTFYSLNWQTLVANKLPAPSNFIRRATGISGPAQSCRNDPDVIGACYTTRARLAVTEQGPGYLLWPVGGRHVMAVASGMAPEDLTSRVSLGTRVYATMLICPVTGSEQAARPSVCVDSASDFKADTIH